MSSMRNPVHDIHHPEQNRRDRNIVTQVLLVAAVICIGLGIVHVEPRWADVSHLAAVARAAIAPGVSMMKRHLWW